MPKRTFTREELEGLGAPHENVIDKVIVDTNRWARHHTGVLSHPDGRHYFISWQEPATEYQRPATEYQRCDPWYDMDKIIAIEVELRTVTTTQWLPVAGTSGQGETPCH